jgi:hypothetical protein
MPVIIACRQRAPDAGDDRAELGRAYGDSRAEPGDGARGSMCGRCGAASEHNDRASGWRVTTLPVFSGITPWKASVHSAGITSSR